MKRNLILFGVALSTVAASLQAADTKETWGKHCAKCHGADGKGQTAMGKKLKVKDYSGAKFQAEFKEDEAIKAIKEGKKDRDKTLMKGFAEILSEQEIKDLVAHIRSFKE